MKALIDTGASRSLLRSDVLGYVQKASHLRTVLQKGPCLQTLSGHKLDILGITEVPVAQVGNITVHIVHNMRHELILGTDSLSQDSIIDYRRKILTWRGRDWPITFRDGSGAAGIDETVIDTGYAAIDDVIQAYSDSFSYDGERTGKCTIRPISIETEGPPVYQKPYRIPLNKRALIDQELDRLLSEGIIRPSNSPWASPIAIVPKKSGEIRLVADLRQVNNVTKKDRYPLPNIQDNYI